MSYKKRSLFKSVVIVCAGAFCVLAFAPLVKNLIGGTTSSKSGSNSSGSTATEETAYITADESCLTSDFGEFHNSTQLSYLNDSYANISSYASGSADLDQPEAITLKWNDTNKSTSGNYTVQLSTDSAFNSAKSYSVTSTSLNLINLRVKSVYYWRVAENGTSLDKAKVYSFTTSSYAPRTLAIDGTLNVRDMGGWTTTSGNEINQEKLFDYPLELHHSQTSDLRAFTHHTH